MNDIESKIERVRISRRKLDQTWAEITPKLTIYGIVDDTVGLMLKKRRSDSMVSAVAVAGAAWLFNSFRKKTKAFKFNKSKSTTLK